MILPKPRTLILAVLGVMLLTAAVGLAMWLIEPDAKIQAQHDRQSAEEAIEAAKAALQTRAPDATSMTYGAVNVNWVGGVPAVCGAVDIVEPQDEFDGPERFVWTAGEITVEEFDGSDAVGKQWDAVCKSM